MSDRRFEVDVEILRKAFDRCLEAIAPLGPKIPIDVDHYWCVAADEVYDLRQAPTEMHVGQVTDEWMQLIDLVESDDDAIFMHLNAVAIILQFISLRHLGGSDVEPS